MKTHLGRAGRHERAGSGGSDLLVPAKPARLEVAGLESGYAKVTILRDISFSVEPGEALGLHGHNGAGKSTLLKTIAGALPLQAGGIFLDGQPVGTLPAYLRVRRGIALVPEGRQIIGSLSVKANLSVMLLARNRFTHDYRHNERMFEILEMFPSLARRLKLAGGSLSGGEQQMLAIARALMIRPSVLLLDEPSQGLSPMAVDDLAGRLHKLKGRVTIILAEQSELLLDSVVDRRIGLRLGELETFDVT